MPKESMMKRRQVRMMSGLPTLHDNPAALTKSKVVFIRSKGISQWSGF
jgi:hypothetical protein